MVSSYRIRTLSLHGLQSPRGRIHPTRKRLAMAIGAVVLCVTVSACTNSSQSGTPTGSPPTSQNGATSGSPPSSPAQSGAQRVDLPSLPPEQSWKQYAYEDAFYTGCPDRDNENGSPSAVHPQVFDAASGRVVAPPQPTLGGSETSDWEVCALTGTGQDLKLFYLMHVVTPANGLTPPKDEIRALIYGLNSPQPLRQADVTSHFGTRQPTVWGTRSGLVVQQVPDRPGLPYTQALSSADLSVLWTDPEMPASVSSDSIVFQRPTRPGEGPLSEIRSPTGESLFTYPNGLFTGSSGDVSGHVLSFQESKPSGGSPTRFYNVTTRAFLDEVAIQAQQGGMCIGALKCFDFTLSNNRLFLFGKDTDIGLQVWNLQTKQVELRKSPEDTKRLNIVNAGFFDNHLYLTTSASGGTSYSVIALPDNNPVAKDWTIEPIQKIRGWTFIRTCPSGGKEEWQCSNAMIADVNGQYPGPWY